MLFALNEHTTSAIDKKTALNDSACLYKVTRVAKFQIEGTKLKSFSKNGYTFAIVYSSKCVTVCLKQTLDKIYEILS